MKDTILKDCPTIKLYLKAGGIPLVRGNGPQASIDMHSKSQIWGAAKNPMGFDRVCSTGEAALVGSKCVPFALGAENINGLRDSAAFNGVFGYKSSYNRCT